jgi:Domain of unknown function (DUF4389)
MDDMKQNLKSTDTWSRILYMLLFVILYSLAEVVLTAVIVFQLLLVLFTASKNARLLKLGQSLSTYVYQILSYLSFNSDYQPYPMGAWPKGEPKVGNKTLIENEKD